MHRNASSRDIGRHLASGAGLGIFLALALIVGNQVIFGAMVHAAQPGLYVFLFVVGTACLTAVGSAISGFILTSLEKNRG